MTSGITTHRDAYDVAFVGLGVSNTFALLDVLRRLPRVPLGAMPRILLIERDATPFTGVAYGPRSGKQSLLITTLDEFVDASLRAEFLDWLAIHRECLLDDYGRHAGSLSRQWLEQYRQSSRQQLEFERCIPRAFFGRFLAEKATAAIASARSQGIADVVRRQADVTDIAAADPGYALQLSSERERCLARSVVLGIGPPNLAALPGSDTTRLEADGRIENRPYERSLSAACAAVARALRQRLDGTAPNVLIVGSNASAIESACLLFDQPGFAESNARIYVMSPAGRFPDRATRAIEMPAFRAANLEALASANALCADDIEQAAHADLDAWERLTEGMNLPAVQLGRDIQSLLGKLSTSERRRFAQTHGIRIGKRQRRAGDEYLDVAERLITQGRIEHCAGRFAGVESADGGDLDIRWIPNGARRSRAFPEPVAAIVNCRGPQRLDESSDPLIRNLVDRGLCVPNEAGRGFEVNDDYEAAPGLIVTGPMISGNVIRDEPVWHVEHCGRLRTIATTIGDLVHGRLATRRPAAA